MTTLATSIIATLVKDNQPTVAQFIGQMASSYDNLINRCLDLSVITEEFETSVRFHFDDNSIIKILNRNQIIIE